MGLARNQKLLVALLSVALSSAIAGPALVPNGNVTYDGRSLIINGKRDLFYSGSIHYTRSPPEVRSFWLPTYIYIYINIRSFVI